MTSSTPIESPSGIREHTQIIGGAWAAAADGATYEVTSPYDDSVVARVPASSRTDMAHAVAAPPPPSPSGRPLPRRPSSPCS
ncbi:hypothetical protein GCM10020295_78870 [Streptomyces cinereospinus]